MKVGKTKTPLSVSQFAEEATMISSAGFTEKTAFDLVMDGYRVLELPVAPQISSFASSEIPRSKA